MQTNRKLYLFLFASFLQTIVGQICSPIKACYPPLENVLAEIDKMDSRVISVSSVCGDPNPSVYRKAFGDTFDDNNFICNSTEGFNHPLPGLYDTKLSTYGENVEVMDPVLDTYWQSNNTVSNEGDVADEQTIVLTLSDNFVFHSLKLVFISPHITGSLMSDMRPKAMVVEKLNGTEWVPLRYYAEDCTLSFPGVTLQESNGPSFSATTAVCMQTYFKGDTHTQKELSYIQQVIFNPALDFKNEYLSSYTVQKHFVTNGLKVRLHTPAILEPLQSYYAIGNMDLKTSCACYGHSSECTGENKNQCVCEHNTMGLHCEECLPLFNNKPWKMGSIINSQSLSNACEDCGCHGHATSCIYNDVKEYGVCQNCSLNTAGDKCEFCVDYYYVNPNWDSFGNVTEDCLAYNCGLWCVPCNCSRAGSLASSSYNCQNSTGQCECKQNVEGRACDVCKDFHWNLALEDPDGCKVCDCDPVGTYNSSNLCDKHTGTCICKSNTEGRKCSECKPGAFNLTISNPDGCDPCDCDPGASEDTTCHETIGTCTCKQYLTGRDCRQPVPGYYIPRLDHFRFEAEFIPDAQTFSPIIEVEGHGEMDGKVSGTGFLEIHPNSQLVFFVSVPKTQLYQVIVRYETSSNFPAVKVVTALLVPEPYTCGGTSYDGATTQDMDKSMLIALSATSIDFGNVCLKASSNYSITIEVGQDQESRAGASILIDSIVLLPVVSTTLAYLNGDESVQQQLLECAELASHMNYTAMSNISCSRLEYSVMAEFYDSALECRCESTGTVANTECAGDGGQCQCKPGVMLLDCSMCKVNHYGYSSGEGCQACGCHETGSQRPSCNETGSCSCKPHVIGNKCDQCEPFHYGLFSGGSGCKACTCNLQYSYNNSCTDDGQCPCKQGIGGATCTQCLDGYYNQTSDGCTSCDCHIDGSTTGRCDKSIGDCSCKLHTTGEKCDQCQPEYFGLGQWSPDGCMPCFCSGHSDNCSSAPDYILASVKNHWSYNDGSAIEDRWRMEDENGMAVPVAYPSISFQDKWQFVMRIINDATIEKRQDVYFLVSSQYLDDMRSAYGFNFTLGIAMAIPGITNYTANISSLELVDRSAGDVVLVGSHVDFTLVASLPSLPQITPTQFTFNVHESQWKVNFTTNRGATYREMLQLLADLKAIRIRGKYSNVSNVNVDIYYAQMFFSVRDNSTGAAIVNNVEQCVCPIAYMGQFCEQCAPGYRRKILNGGPYSECIPCDCNGHSTETSCDVETGTCYCAHNTTGTHCEKCVEGFFGTPTEGTPYDCSPCMCPGNVIEGDLNVFASTCSVKGDSHMCHNCTEGHGGDRCQVCLQDWYGQPENVSNAGGVCSQCSCNNRAITCDTETGYCIDCANNTAGQHCDICAPKYFGNAMTEKCQPCACSNLGATGFCNHLTGTCECHPNVQGLSCDSCILNSFNYTSGQGCTLCDCDPVGSIATSCNTTTGQCLCRTHVIGRQCNYCEDTYWNVNEATGCNECECNPAGTLNTTSETFGKCNVTSGQCTCAKEAIIGVTCDQCAKGTKVGFQFVEGIYVGEFPDCELCGECYDNWAKNIDEVGVVIQQQYGVAIDIWNNYDNASTSEVSPLLDGIRGNISQVESSIGSAQTMTQNLLYLQQGFDQIQAEIEKFSSLLNVIEELRAVINNNLTIARQYTSETQVSPGVLKTANQILNSTIDARNHLNDSSTNATSSYDNIIDMADTLRNSNTTVQELITRVAESMNTLDEAIATRGTVESIIGGNFEVQFNTNNDALTNAAALDVGFPPRITSVGAQLNSTTVNLTFSENICAEVEVLATDLRDSMLGNMTHAQIVKFNSSEADRVSQMGQSAARAYQETAQWTKGNMTDTIESIAQGMIDLQQADNDSLDALAMAQNTLGMNLRQLDDIQSITSEITATSIASIEVEQVFQEAESALTEAEQALQVTEQAQDSAEQSLGQVQTIQQNLVEASQLRNDSTNILNEAVQSNTTVSNILSQVNTKTMAASSLGTTASDMLTNLLQQTGVIQQCFADEEAVSADYFNKAKDHLNAAIATQTSQVDNGNYLQSLSEEISSSYTDATSKMADIEVLEGDVNTLEDDLQAVKDITNLADLLDSYNQVKIEMQTTEQDMIIMEAELDFLISSLETFNPDTVSCNSP
ncbi:unnamed protein product [Owenia fusiformis]|uniref:Laminin-like protein epi-1 n=1 Tax=Owenia fusiformis TaxID=6347 RepID=A0A8S4P3S4_OWEFU|nr:unnamed protein product [Owenia fusiformis]